MTTSQTVRRLAGLALTLALVPGCADDPLTSPPTSDPVDPAAIGFELSMEDGLDFEPRVLTVPAGSTIEIINQSSRAHSVTSDDSAPVAFDTGAVPEGDTAELRLTEVGTYEFYCRFHPEVMTGVIVVEEAEPADG